MSDAGVQEKYMAYCKFGAKDNAGLMESKTFFKLCKEAGLLNKTCTQTDCDLTFAKVKAKGKNKIEYKQFLEGLHCIAEKAFPKEEKTAAHNKALQIVAASTGPQSSGTKADFVKFHDDKSQYTGVYARGGPTNVDGKITLSNLADRSGADARGVKK